MCFYVFRLTVTLRLGVLLDLVWCGLNALCRCVRFTVEVLKSNWHCNWRSVSLSVLVSSRVWGSWRDISSSLKVTEDSGLLDQRKEAKLQWLQDPSEIKGDNLNNIRRETRRYFRNKKREYLKTNLTSLQWTNSKKIRYLYKGINEFKRGYQPRSILVKNESGDLLAESHNILNRSKNYFSQLLNVHRVSDARQIEIHTVSWAITTWS
jgi:hypothetical protein